MVMPDNRNEELRCPACGQLPVEPAIEKFGKYLRFACAGCDLHYWYPRALPPASWYEQMYGGRDTKVLPLEPGHKYFLADPLAPRRGELLDIGCGTGNFLAAARDAGYSVTGTELDRNAAKYASVELKLARVYSLTAAEFASRNSGATFDVVTFFEVLEHQAWPKEFIASIRSLVRPGGFIALSVPNRERWLTGPDVLDYPPNHFLRWNMTALRKFLGANGFEILSVREQRADLGHTAQMLNMAMRSGLLHAAGAAAPSFREVMQMEPEEASRTLKAKANFSQRTLGFVAQVKSLACVPLAAAVYPYVYLRELKGTYLYCLARRTSRQSPNTLECNCGTTFTDSGH